MIWIATLCLLAVAAWLLFNGINERRWVQAHSHDETVAADEGFLPDFSAMVAKRRVDGDGKVPISEEDTFFARAVSKVREKSAGVSEKLEARVAAADGPSFFDRSVERVRGATDKVGGMMDERMRRERMKGEEAAAGRPITEEGGLFPGAVGWVSEKTGAVGERLAERAKRSTGADGQRVSLEEEDSLFARAVKKVGGSLERVEGKLDAQAAKSHDQDEDFLTRTSRKVGPGMERIDERIVEQGRKVNDIEARVLDTGDDGQGSGKRG